MKKASRKRGAAETGRGQVFHPAGLLPAAKETTSSRTLLHTEELRVVVMELDSGQELTAHQSPRRVLVQVLKGRCSFQMEAEWRELQTGDLVHLPPNLVHAVRAQEACTLLLTMAPVGSAKASAEPASG